MSKNNLVQTKSFQIAVYAKGNPSAEKLAIVVPGRLDTKDYVHMQSLVDSLAEQGYYALAFDPPGTWESPGDISAYTTTNTLQATNELIEHFGNKPTILLGHSRGGANAMLAGAANPLITHIVAIMSPSGPSKADPPESGRTHVSTRDMPPGTQRTQDRKSFALPATYFDDQAQYDAMPAMQTCTKPKLFFYGTEDVLISEASVKELYQAAANPKAIHALQSEHDYRLHPEIVQEVNETIAAFLRANPV